MKEEEKILLKKIEDKVLEFSNELHLLPIQDENDMKFQISEIIAKHKEPTFTNIEYISDFIDDAIICCEKVFQIDADFNLISHFDVSKKETKELLTVLLKNLRIFFGMLQVVTQEFYESSETKYQDRYIFGSTLRGTDFKIDDFIHDVKEINFDEDSLPKILRCITRIMKTIHKYLIKLITDFAKSTDDEISINGVQDSPDNYGCFHGIIYCLMEMISIENEIIMDMNYEKVKPYQKDED